MTTNTTYLITGANRGIGRGLATAYLLRPNSTVIAAVRDPEKSTSKDLANLPTAQGSKLITVKIDSTSESDPAEAVKSLSEHSVSHLDVVIANAGDSRYAHVADVSIGDMMYLYKTNTIGPLLLLQATLPLLKAASTPKFI
ncbi:hypothetical protein LTS18_002658, partial [Coniosporium uncinatum]